MSTDITINPRYKMLRPWVENIARNGIPAGSREIYRGRNIVWVAPCPDAPGGELSVKQFAIPGLFKGLIYGTMRHPKAQRAYHNAHRLRRMGFDTPEHVAYITHTIAGKLSDSYYICLQLNGYDTLRLVHKHPNFDIIIDDIAKLMMQLHARKVWFKDFSPGNVLMRRKPDGRYAFALVDINRIEFGVNDRSKLWRNFAAILDRPDDIERLARLYAGHAGFPEHDVVATARRNYRRLVERAGRKNSLKRLIHK